jgi:hypothetical protein
MYKTIEADIENGVISSSGKDKLPAKAHVLITLLSGPIGEKSEGNGREEAYRMPHPDLKNAVELEGDLLDTVPHSLWNLPT